MQVVRTIQKLYYLKHHHNLNHNFIQHLFTSLAAEAKKAAIFSAHPDLFHYHAWQTLDKQFLTQPIVSVKLSKQPAAMHISEYTKDN